jgi:hypothetical protein
MNKHEYLRVNLKREKIITTFNKRPNEPKIIERF